MPHVIFLAPGPAGQRRFLRGLKRVGAHVTGIGPQRPESLDGELRYLLDAYEYVPDLADEDAIVEAVVRVQTRGPWVDRLETVEEDHLLVAARTRERTAIPGPSVEQVERTRDKLRMKEFLSSHDVHSAPGIEVRSAADARAFVARVGYPVILKPRAGSGLGNLFRIDDEAGLDRTLAATALGSAPGGDGPRFVLEKFVDGHEGSFDTLLCNGRLLFEAATHFYPNVLEALRTRSVNPIVIHTNRLAEDGYDDLRAMNRRVLGELGLETTTAHLDWFRDSEGLWFSELGLHPPPYDFWDLHCESGEIDLYTEWARAVCYGVVESHDAARFASGIINLRPDRDGVIVRYEGVERMQRSYGDRIFRMHLPPPGTRTQPIESGYLANAYVCLKDPDYDTLRTILADIGETVKVIAGPAEPGRS